MMPIIALVAILIHFYGGYLCILNPSYHFLQKERPLSIVSRTPIHTQENMVFIAWPIVGYTLWLVLKDMGGDSYLLIPSSITIHVLAFSTYYMNRLDVGRKYFIMRLLFVGLMFVGILISIVLLIKLFFYYIICITLGWFFLITPFAALSYYALIQAIIFMGSACRGIIFQDLNRPIALANIASYQDVRTFLCTGWFALLLYFIVSGLILLFMCYILSSDFMGPFQLSYELITDFSRSFI